MIAVSREGAMRLRVRKLGWALGLAWFLEAGACGGEGAETGPTLVTVEVEPAVALAVGVGDTVRFAAAVKQGTGSPATAPVVAWRSSNTAVATVDAEGRAVAVAAGTAIVTATSQGSSGRASLEVWIPAKVTAHQPGTSYFGRQSYVEYIPGELPLILSAPHGGSLTPTEIPDRTVGTTVTDSNLRETLLELRTALMARTGKAPHVILSHLKRTKLDPNREIVEAAAGNPFAENAWEEFHGYIETAAATVTKTYGSGLYVDMHGHDHAIARIELGYLLSASQLNLSDAEMDAPGVAAASSIRALAAVSPLPFARLLRGPTSLGGFMQMEGIRSVPSPGDPSPGSAAYFTGGYSTETHGSRGTGRTVSGVQFELPYAGTRDSAQSRQALGQALARVLETFMIEHYGFFRVPR